MKKYLLLKRNAIGWPFECVAILNTIKNAKDYIKMMGYKPENCALYKIESTKNYI